MKNILIVARKDRLEGGADPRRDQVIPRGRLDPGPQPVKERLLVDLLADPQILPVPQQPRGRGPWDH